MGQGVESSRSQKAAISCAQLVALSCLFFSPLPTATATPAGDGDLEAEIQAIEVLSKTADWQEAERRLDELTTHLEEADPSLQFRADLILARSRSIGGDENGALDMLEDMRAEAPSERLRLEAYSLSANLAMNVARHGEAFDHLREALSMLDGVEAPGPRARVYGHAAMIYSRLGELEQAVQFGERAVRTARIAGDPRELCVELERLSTAERDLRGWQERYQTVREGEAVCEASGDELFAAAMRFRRAELYRDAGDTETALAVMEEARDLMETLGFERGQVMAELSKGEFLLALGRLEEAAPRLANAVEALEARGELIELDRALKSMAELLEARGEYQAAVAHWRRAREVRDEWSDRERSLRRDYLRTAFETEHQEQELALLREQARVAELEATTRHQRRLFLILGYAGTAVVSVLLFVMLMRSSRERRHFRRLSQRDSLTGLLNHSHFFAAAQLALDRARACEQGFVLVMADIDYFKQFNDRYGHAAGDGALRKVASLFQQVFGEDAVIGRIGGEEFALALGGWDREQVLARIEHFRRKLAPLSHEGRKLRITLSFGLVVAQPGMDVQRMRRTADEALYQAKGEGRDRVIEIQPEPPSGPSIAESSNPPQ